MKHKCGDGGSLSQFDVSSMLDLRAHMFVWQLPATEDGICAARVLTHRHGIQTNLSLVSCLAHAAACIEAGAGLVSMSVEPVSPTYARCIHLTGLHPRSWNGSNSNTVSKQVGSKRYSRVPPLYIVVESIPPCSRPTFET